VSSAWSRVNELFHQALELDPDARGTFLATLNTQEPEVGAEVASLLDAHERAAAFIEEPAATRAELDTLARTASTAGRTIGHYRVRRVLGEGGMGVVYLADDTRLGRTVALKALAPRFSGDPQRTERLRREARAAASLAHPGIATVYALEELEGQLYIASEYVAGETLRDEMEVRGPLGPQRARETGVALARALSVAHKRGIVHRDLKPENVIRTPDDEVKILDFGIAKFSDPMHGAAELTGDSNVLGTPGYMSPEQIRGLPVDARSDIFSLGVLIYELATGCHPFGDGNGASKIARILEGEPRPFVRAGGTREPDRGWRHLEAVIATCLQKTADARFQSAAELCEALQAAGADAATPADPLPPLKTKAVWWWQFHQVGATLAYIFLLWPVWEARDLSGADRGMLLFLAGVAAGTVAGSLRMHLLFADRHYPEGWHDQLKQSTRWIRGADALFAVVLVAAGLNAIRAEAPAVVLVAAAVWIAVSSAIIEPATTRAAFRNRR